MTNRLRVLAGLTLLALCSGAFSPRGFGDLQPGDVVAICGDSITEQCLYSSFIATYLLACQPVGNIRTYQFGLSGETSWEFLGRIGPDVMGFRPTVATTCYGMNDGGYAPIDPQRQLAYRRATAEIVQKLKNGGVRLVVVGSPGAVDSHTFNGSNGITAEEYNTGTLRGLARIAREVAAEEGAKYADVHEVFCQVMEKAKARFGSRYHVAGADGVHPAANGHLIIAYAFLKALGCDGNIGTINVDLAEKRASASQGHQVLSFDGETIEIESVRYPFCFYGDPGDPESTRGIIDVLPFNEELNRLQLIVTGAPTAQLKISWGNRSKVFEAGQLAKGINLAAEFLDNPFGEPFEAVEDAVRKQQQYEAFGVRGLLGGAEGWRWEKAPSSQEDANRPAKARALEDAARSAVKPVQHILKVRPAP